MQRRTPRPGEKYMDAQRNLYQILCIANRFDTKEKMVVYQALYGDFECFVRPLEEIDEEQSKKRQTQRLIPQPPRRPISAPEPLESAKAASRRPLQTPETAAPASDQTEQEQANPALLRFLDADTLEDKYQVIKSLGNEITDRLIDDFAVVLDLVIPSGSTDSRYQQLLNSIRTMQKYENSRLRRR